MKNKKILIPIIIVVAVLIIIVTAALAVLSNKQNENNSSSAEENQKEAVELSSQEITNYNTAITNNIGLGQAIIGSDVYTIIDKIIESNDSNYGKAGLFISIDATAVSQDIGIIGEGGTLENSSEYVADCRNKMETLKGYINTLKYYDIDETYDRSRDILIGITIKENTQRNNSTQTNITNETNITEDPLRNTNDLGLATENNNQVTNTVTTQENTMSEFEKQAKELYNFSVSVYAGNNKKGIDARSCIDAIIASNNNNVGDPGKFIALTINGTQIGTPGNQNNNATEVQNCASQMQTQRQGINTGKSYVIVVSYGTDGYVNNVSITQL